MFDCLFICQSIISLFLSDPTFVFSSLSVCASVSHILLTISFVSFLNICVYDLLLRRLLLLLIYILLLLIYILLFLPLPLLLNLLFLLHLLLFHFLIFLLSFLFSLSSNSTFTNPFLSFCS